MRLAHHALVMTGFVFGVWIAPTEGWTTALFLGLALYCLMLLATLCGGRN